MDGMTTDVRTIEWTGDGLRLLDQTVPPGRVEYLTVRDVDALVGAIRRLAVRGAPALGVAGAFGVAIAVRQAASGDTANKIGSLGVALACQAAGIPFVVAAPRGAVDLAVPDGTGVPIEERPAAEIAAWNGVPTVPDGVDAFNPAFDVTPARLVTALVTETGVLGVSSGGTPRHVRKGA